MRILTPVLAEEKATSKSQRPYGGTLFWGTCIAPTIINPVLTTYSGSAPLIELVFTRLIRIDSKDRVIPDMAEIWNISSDGLTYTFYLRKGVRFHDGAECTAYDVEFTYDKIVDPNVKSPFKELFRLVEEFRALDKYTFRITLKEPSVSFIYRLTKKIMPRHLLKESDLRKCSFNRHPIGAGPFKFKEWRDNNEIVLEFNPDYYEGRPCLDRIIVKTYANSEDMWTALMCGEVDYVTFIERENYELVKDDPSFKAFAVPRDYYYGILYNLGDSILSDKRVRYAIAHGMNRKELIRRIAYGYGLDCKGPFHPDLLGFNPEVQAFEYNPEKALELLARAGWTDEDNDGILEKQRKELQIRILVDSRVGTYKKITMFVRQQLKELGIKTKVVLYDGEKMLTQEFIEKNRIQAHLRIFSAGVDPGLAGEEWHNEASKRMFRLWPYNNEKVERLLQSGDTTYDKEERKKIYQGVHRLIYEDQPVCFLFFPYNFHAVSAKFKNTDNFFTASMPYYTIKDWYLKDRKRGR